MHNIGSPVPFHYAILPRGVGQETEAGGGRGSSRNLAAMVGTTVGGVAVERELAGCLLTLWGLPVGQPLSNCII